MQQQHTGLMRAHAMRAADSVQRLLATGSGSTDGVGVGPRATALAGLGGRGGGGVPAAPVAAPVAAAAAPFHLSWKVGERTKYDKAVVFECPAISGLTAEQLARKVFRGALREQAAAFPHIEQQFVDAANDNFLIGMNITCGVVSPADVAEQLMSRHLTVSNTNLLSLVSVWVKKYVDENVAASQVLGVSLGSESTWDAGLAGSTSRRREQPEGGTGHPPPRDRGGTRLASVNDIDDEEEPDDSITPYVTINGGDFEITTSEGEGIEAKGTMTINDGTININSYDDGLNAGDDIYINGGNIYVYATLNDAIDSNGGITVTGGTTIAIAVRTDEPDGSFDCDDNTFKITGGTILGLALNTSFPTESESTQNAVIFDGVNANQLLNIQSEDGTEALTYEVPYSVNTIIYSNAKLETDQTYTIYTGGSVSNGTEVNGLYTSGTYSGGTDSGDSFTISSTVTQIGGEMGPTGEPGEGGPGGN